jgi:hypothetical protein
MTITSLVFMHIPAVLCICALFISGKFLMKYFPVTGGKRKHMEKMLTLSQPAHTAK